jgi:dihydroorotate dehydrogenase
VTYPILFQLVLRRLPPEAAHSLAARTLWALGKVPGFRSVLRRLLAPTDDALRVNAFGLAFPSPLGVAAGMDKNLTWFEELGALGFGFVEVGTVTALPQRGNPRPRVHRLLADHALINRMGFPNKGASAAVRRLAKRTGGTLIAVNIGRSRAAADANADYCESARQLAPLADLLVLNVSSPNTPGLRDMQAPDALASLVREVRAEIHRIGASVPLLIKISPDLANDEIDSIARAALSLGLAGIVAVNTTTSRDGLADSGDVSEKPGGLSGPPLKRRALEVLRRLHATTKDDLVLVSVGGIETADDVMERVRAGATLVQAHTGFVYGGPHWPSSVNRDLARKVRAAGVATI